MDPLAGLNPSQTTAAAHQNGPLLVVAGAGAGKTKTVAHRIWNLIHHGVPPEAILAITFTNKAASEMRERVHRLVTAATGENRQPFVSTFHALGVFIIRENAALLGLSKFFSIIDKDEALSAIKSILKERGHDPKTVEPKKVLSAISRAKGAGITQSNFAERHVESYFGEIVSSVWRAYDSRLKEQGALDFDDLLQKTVELWKNHPAVLERYQNRWRYLHIDEYQDTNSIQYQMARLLAARHRNICVVGDIDQSIYSWRGADYKNIMRFEEDYPDATVVTLEQNYRSTKTILAAANAVIKKNRSRREKNLFTDNEDGELIKLIVAFDGNDEAARIANEANALIRSGTKASDIAVLYRANFLSRALEEAFLRAGVHYHVLGTRFFERAEVKDVLAFLKAALNPQDIESTKRIINVPARGIGKVTLAKLFAHGPDSLAKEVRKKVNDFYETMADIKRVAEQEKPSVTIKYIVERSGLANALKAGGDDDLERLENVRELATLATKYDDLGPEEGIWKLLTEAALMSDQDELTEDQKGVHLMTVHAAKGLEFDYVFVAGLEQDLFPSGRSKNEDADHRDDEEERRLFYVAVTRAKKRLYLTYAQMRTIYGQRMMTLPSEFIGDIAPELLEAEDAEDPFKNSYFIDF